MSVHISVETEVAGPASLSSPSSPSGRRTPSSPSGRRTPSSPSGKSPAAAACGIRSQEEMCRKFIPILKEKGKIVHKKGARMARLAKRGEEVLTIIDGEVVARKTVQDDTSMVIRQDSADHELYALDARSFELNYVTPGVEVDDGEKHHEELRQRGFRKYERKGQALIYQVTEEDMKFAPAGKFYVIFSPEPQPLRVGDYLVTGYPDSKEVYMSRNATIYKDVHLAATPRKPSLIFLGEGNGPIRSQEDMCAHFIPILKERGTLVKKAGKRLARPGKRGEIIQTIIDGEVVAKTIVADDTTMVIRQESADNELYTLDARKFEENYETPGADIIETDARFEVLRKRGFRYYTRRGQLLIYQVTAKDLEYVPEGTFQVAFSTYPQPLRLGDYLVTTYPDTQEIYMSRHDAIYKDGHQSSFGPSIRVKSPFEGNSESKDPDRQIMSQKDMCRHFIPILRDKGIIVNKMGKRMARPAKNGEIVQTIINGEIVARTIVKDCTSMVIRQESADHEFYVLDEKKFRENYELPGVDIMETEPRFEELRQRGFKYYERKGQSKIYQVTEKDMEFVPGGEFEVSFSADPQPLRVGDYLVTGYPDAKEVYMSRHATIYQDRQHFHGPGVKTQEEMRAHFLPKMKEQGMTLRRAGMRLARPAKKGEEVLTTINGEVMSKTVVSDDSSMVIQEESADREVYSLSAEQFALSYNLEGIEIEDQGSEYDILRERGYKYYEKTGGMVTMYRVTDDDMEFIPSGKFQVPFSIVPQPLKAGDYLITSLELGDCVIYVSRNAEQIFMTQKNLEIHYVFGSPMSHPPLSINAELDGLRTSGAIVRLTCAIRENLIQLKKAWSGLTSAVLHISCHTNLNQTGAGMILEDEAGKPNRVTAEDFSNLVIGNHAAPEVVVLNSCNSQSLAHAFIDRGVRRVVAVRAQHTLLDRAARDFTLAFYGELRAHRSVEAAFSCAVESMKASKDLELAAEASKFVLLPEGSTSFNLGDRRAARSFSGLDTSIEPHIGVRVPFGVGEARCVGPLVYPPCPSSIQGPIPLSRRRFLCDAMAVFANFRVLKICGPTGSGKKALAEQIATFSAQPGGRLFSGGTAVIHGRLGTGVVSQQQMREHFLPILNEKGQLVQKMGRLMARKAHPGETVLTVINGEVVARKTVDDETSMVVRHDSADHELYVHSAQAFAKNYEIPGSEITDDGVEFDVLRERGFMYYERKGMALIYKVTEADMIFVPEEKFQVTFSSTPQPLQVGDYLATGFPNKGSGEIYLSRNAEQVYLSKIIRSNEEMRRHFAPIMMKQGRIARRVGTWPARPAILGEQIATVVGGEVVARTVVVDSTSMVVQADSADREQYVLDAQSFAKSYKPPGLQIPNEGGEFDILREQGFMYYERKGMVRIYQVREADLDFVPVGKFGHGKTTQQELHIGDYLVCEYPEAGEVYVSRNAEQVFAPPEAGEVIRSQDDMREHFLPILKEQGKIMSHSGRCAARPAVKGEVIRTIIDGEMVAKVTVSDDRSMVIREETSDRELYAFTRKAFGRLFSNAGVDITEFGYEFEALRDRGFKWHARRGAALVYKVTEEDMDFVLGGKFNVSFSSIPQPLRLGDHLATQYPACGEVFLSRNARQVYTADTDMIESSLPTMTISTCSLSRAPSDSCDLPPTLSRDASAQGSPALWLNLDSRRSNAEFDADSLPTPSPGVRRPSSGLRETAELEEAIVAAATKQAQLARRWYNVKEIAGQSKERNKNESQAEAAVASWLDAVPSRSNALLVLVDADHYMAHAAPRGLLRRLLLKHQNLHLLISASSAEAAGPILDPSVKEHPWVVPLPVFEPREAAELFLFALLRRPQCRRLVQMSREVALERLEKHAAVHSCKGNPGSIFRRVEQIDEHVSSLDGL